VYIEYFSLREAPFSIAPDPAYLYMSARHQEALGHLLYGTGQYGGFVQLTGEVGTGKTTIVRTLLAQKLEKVDVAMIHNPRQSEQEFVATICDELRVPYRNRATLKTLVDELNARLLGAHAAGRRTVLIIDEAQNLAPGVLEQVRLLTNLETDKEKLMRILLVGQPELSEMLSRPDLRQLASRITARYHLLPLSATETREYIVHRLRVAGGRPDLFTPAAIDRVHHIARGNPRQINIICDRALLGAYSQGLRQVTPEIVDHAAQEALGVDPRATVTVAKRFVGWLNRIPLLWIEGIVACLAVLLLGVLLHRALSGGTTRPTGPATIAAAGSSAPTAAPESPPAIAADATTTSAPAAPAPAPTSAVKPVAPSGPMLGGSDLLGSLQRSAEPLPRVLSRLIRLWNSQLTIPAGENVCQALSHVRIGCYRSIGGWSDLEQINRPAVLTLNLGGGELMYVVLRALGPDYAVLEGSEGAQRYRLDDLDNLWTGEFLLLWQHDIDATQIGPQTRGAPVIWLRRQLALAAGEKLASGASDRYDAHLADAVRQFQTSHGLVTDGVAGIRTLIALSDVNRAPGTPLLNVEASP
jgi:general secretion pathway protein A